MSRRCNICYNETIKLDIIVHEGEDMNDMLMQLSQTGELDYEPHYICRPCYDRYKNTGNTNCPFCRKKYINCLDTSSLDPNTDNNDEQPQQPVSIEQYKELEKKYKLLENKYKRLQQQNQQQNQQIQQICKVNLSEINENNVFEKIPKMYGDILKHKFYNETINYIKGLKKYKDYGYSFGGNYTYIKWLINESVNIN
jgi:hypothetical protein